MILVDFSETVARHREVIGKVFEVLDKPFFEEHGFKGNESDLKFTYREANRNLRERESRLGDFTVEVAKLLKLNISTEDAVKKEENFDKKYIELIEPIPGAIEGLKRLAKLDELVLLTNSACRRVIPIIDKFKLSDVFSQIICLGGTGQNKSQGDLFSKMKKLGAWVIIGSNPRKDERAEEFGITFINVRVGWETTVNLVEGLKEDKLRFKE